MDIFERFQASPFGPLNEHMHKVKECVTLVEPMFRLVREGNFDGLRAMTDQVFRLEHQADEIKTQIRRCVPKTFFLPIYRGDLLALLTLQDDIADAVEDLGVLLTIKYLRLPEPIAKDTFDYIEGALTVCDLLFRCTDQLADLTDDDFGGAKTEQIFGLVDQAEHAEWEADKAQYALAQKLFALDDQLKATDIFLWSNILQKIGELANSADRTAERLRRILVK